jgi:hypothetical protein
MGRRVKIRFFSDAYKRTRASHRLRGEVTAGALADLGYDAKILTDSDPHTGRPVLKIEALDKNTIVIFLKGTTVSTIERAKAAGAITVYDLCDNKFDEKKEYAPCCMTADLVSVNSVQMGISVKENTDRDSTVMPDPYERPKLVPTFDPGAEIKLLWFGSQASFKFLPLVEVWQRLETEIGNYRYAMISSKTDRLLSKMTLRANKGAITGVNFDRLDMHNWTWELQGQLMAECDIVLMPVAVDNYRTDTKSANRVIDSLISGKFVITTPLASYEEFAPYTWQGDYIEGIKWARNNPTEVVERITQGQRYVEEHYSAAMLSKKFIEDIIHAAKR